MKTRLCPKFFIVINHLHLFLCDKLKTHLDQGFSTFLDQCTPGGQTQSSVPLVAGCGAGVGEGDGTRLNVEWQYLLHMSFSCPYV